MKNNIAVMVRFTCSRCGKEHVEPIERNRFKHGNNIFSRIFKDAIKIGESNNSLQETMEKFSSTIYDDLMYDLDKLASNLSIFLNVFSGIILSTILLNIIGPIYDLAEKIENM